MSAQDQAILLTPAEDAECQITEVKEKEEEENIYEHTLSSRNATFQTEFSSTGLVKKRKRSRAPPGKPPYSYVALITMAITSSPWRKMTLAEVLKFIPDNFPYYRTCPLKWRNAIRQLPRDSHDGNRGHYWTVDPASEMMFDEGSYRRRKRRYTRREDLDEISRLLVERTNIGSYDPPAHMIHAIPYSPRVPVISHVSTQPRRGFSIDDILADRPTTSNNNVSTVTTHTLNPQVQAARPPVPERADPVLPTVNLVFTAYPCSPRNF